jgi:hypothetical protein
MLARYQNGCLQTIIRKDGVERWQFRWLQKGADGMSREREKTIGAVKVYPEDRKKAAGFVGSTAAKHQHRWPDRVDFDNYD